MTGRLEDLLRASARHYPDRIAVEDPGQGTSCRYAELDRASDEVCRQLVAAGIQSGDRVGVFGKSIPALAAIFGILKAGAAYVPIDVASPRRRAVQILTDCAVVAVLGPETSVDPLCRDLGRDGVAASPVDPFAEELSLVLLEAAAGADGPGSELAYLLYTSGSTGKPKGVMHTHASALSFVSWCSDEFAPECTDRFSSHAPFHFDLSILDVFVPLKHGAAVVLIGPEVGRQPVALAELIAERDISVWYSTPSTLSLLAEYGKLERLAFPRLRTVLFAGEVFPVPAFRRLTTLWPTPSYYNLFGPTETNVCTFYRVPDPLPTDCAELPIGWACSGTRTRVLDEHGDEVGTGERGELCVSGGSVMAGYWGDTEATPAACWKQGDQTWYRTGDLVVETREGYLFRGRRDRMIKRRGHRIEPGEIEATLHLHPDIVEAAVLARGEGEGLRVVAWLAARGGGKLPLVSLKQWCAANMPLSMIPDEFCFRDSLPKTSTDKIDYRTLADLV